MTSPASPQPETANLDELAADAVITYQVAMVGPRMVSGLPEFDTMPSDERETWREYVRRILRDDVPTGTYWEQADAWQAVARMVREAVSR